MKNWLIIIACILGFAARAQEKLNTFHIIDGDTKAPVPSVSVSIVRAGLSITTEKDGIFSIPGDLSKMRDTVILYTQNYAPFKIQLRSLSGMDTINMTRLIIKPVSAKANYKGDSLLNDYKRKEIIYYAGLHSETELFNYLQLAQQFNVQQEGVLLRKVWVNRLRFTKPGDFMGVEKTKFRIRVYDINPVTGGPGNDLCNRVIEVKNHDSNQESINLEKYNIVIPHQTFFVAIEWLRDYLNMNYSMVYDKKQGKDLKLISYRPLVGLSPVKGSKLNIWGMNFKREWKPYNYFYPYGTDLAIRISVKY